MDEFPDLYDDNSVGTDNAGDTYIETEPDTSGSDTGSGSGGAENPDAGIPGGAPDVDSPADGAETETRTDDLNGTETDGENSGNTVPDSTGNGDSDGARTEKEDGNVTDEKDVDGTESGGDGTPENEGVNTEILTDINDALHTHTENVQVFFTDTVSGNAVIVTPGDSMSAFLSQGIENQTLDIQNQLEILDRLDMLNGAVMLLFVLLVFDMLHRFAKRIVRNLMKGDTKNGTDI